MTQGAASGAAIDVPAIRAKRTARAIGPGPPGPLTAVRG